MAAKELLQAGLRKSIGSRFNTKVWSDPWIPVIPSKPARHNGAFRDPQLFVSHLTDINTKQWKQDALHNIIDPEDIPRILSLRPSRGFKTDGYCWIHTKSGIYTVRSGYALANELQEAKGPIYVSEPSSNPFKNKVWELKTSRKIKHFLWQALSGCVAVKNRLVDRHCGIDRTCNRCGTGFETINHLIFECPTAVQTWNLSSIPTVPGVFSCESQLSNFDFLLNSAKKNGVPETYLEVFPWIIWHIWKARNEKTFKDKDIAALDTMQLATQEAGVWKVAQIVEERVEADIEENPQIQLAIPALYRPRCRFDASCTQDGILFGGGVVAEVVDGYKSYGLFAKERVLSPLHAEFMSLIWAMRGILQMGILSMSFESDCLQLVNLIENDEEWPSLASELEEFNTIRSSFTCFYISYIPRELNVRADLLAKEARKRECVFSHWNSSFSRWLTSGLGFLET